MRITQVQQFIIVCTLVITSLLVVTATIFGAEQEFKTLELIRTYQPKEDVHSAYPEQFPLVEKISPNGDSFQLATPQKERLRTFEIESLTETERQTLQTSNKAEPIIKNGIMRWLSNDGTMLLEADVTVNVRESGQLQEGDVSTKNLTLYNARGEVITQLPPEVNMVKASPDRQYFVAYTHNVYGLLSDKLFFYNNKGRLLNTQHILEQPQVMYSQNGEFVQVYSDSEWIFAIFTNTGELVFQGNYIDLLKNVRSPLWRVYTSEQGTHMLLFTSQRLDLYTTHGEFVWTHSIPKVRVVDCWFFSAQGKIVLQTMTSRSGDDRYDLQIHNLHTGEKLEEFSGIAEMTGVNSHLIVTKEGQYYEYQVR